MESPTTKYIQNVYDQLCESVIANFQGGGGGGGQTAFEGPF